MSAPTLFTHSYFAGEGAVENPAADYIKSAIVVEGKTFSEACEGPDGERYVFSFWLNIQRDQLVAVCPSDAVIDGWRKFHGGVLVSLTPMHTADRDLARIRAGMREPSSRSGYSWDAIAGNVSVSDLCQHMISLLGEDFADDIKKVFAQK